MHATAIAKGDHAALILGPSGSGKSSLALQLISLGCCLISDDQTELFEKNGVLFCRKPDSLPALIEAREFGLLSVPMQPEAQVSCLIDMTHTETERLPEPQTRSISGHNITLFQKSTMVHFPAAIVLYLDREKGPPSRVV